MWRDVKPTNHVSVVYAFFDAVQLVKTRALLDRITDPRFGPNDAARPRRLATLDDLQAVLQPGELLLDVHVGATRSMLAAVTADSLRLVELPNDHLQYAITWGLLALILAVIYVAYHLKLERERREPEQ